MLIERVLRGGQQTCVLHLLIFYTTLHDGVEHGAGLIHVACLLIGVHQGSVLGITAVAGIHGACASPNAVTDFLLLSQVHQADDVARVFCSTACVGHPQLDAVDGDAAGDVGQGGTSLVVSVVEVMCQEEVAVLIVVVRLDFKGGQLASSLAAYGLRLRFLLAHHRLQLQTSKLKVSSDTKQ